MTSPIKVAEKIYHVPVEVAAHIITIRQESDSLFELWTKSQRNLRFYFITTVILCILCSLTTCSLVANNAELFSEDLEQIETTISSAISASQTAPGRACGVYLIGYVSHAAPGPLSIPSFAWGCFFGVAGIVVVNACTSSQEESTKALKGCLINSAVLVAANVILFAASL